MPNAIENTLKIAESIDIELPMGQYHLQTFQSPRFQDQFKKLKSLCVRASKEIWRNITEFP